MVVRKSAIWIHDESKQKQKKNNDDNQNAYYLSIQSIYQRQNEIPGYYMTFPE